MFPRARKDDLTIRELPGETLVYDRQRHKAHCLNAAAALVWRHCDGKTSVDELAEIVAREMGIPQGGEVVALALAQLGRRHLLDATPPLPRTDPVTRREALRKLALAAALPLVLTIATRTAAQTLSDPSTPTVVANPVVIVNGGGTNHTPVPGGPYRKKGQSCLAASSGVQGTCCAGLTCGGVAAGAGVCA